MDHLEAVANGFGYNLSLTPHNQNDNVTLMNFIFEPLGLGEVFLLYYERVLHCIIYRCQTS